MPRPPRADAFFVSVAALVRGALWCMTTKRWSGAEHFPREGGFIVAGNHMSNVDPLTFAHFVYNSGHVPRFLAKAPLFKVPVVGWVLRKAGQIPVYRNTADAGTALRAAVAALEAGECVVVFPEGTLTRDPDLWPMVGKTGVARLALETGVPVVPVAQWGPQHLLGRYSKVLKPFPRKAMTVVAGPPVDLSAYAGRPLDAATLREATATVLADVTALLAGIRQETPPATPFDLREARRGGTKPVGGDRGTREEHP